MNSSTSEMNQEAIVKVEAVFGERIYDVASKTVTSHEFCFLWTQSLDAMKISELSLLSIV